METQMPVWVVRAIWIEDDQEVSEEWSVEAGEAHEAVREVSARLPYNPHHIEARRQKGDEAQAAESNSLTG
jgi:hypothetical protein